MTTPAYNELIATIRQEGEAIVAAARLGLDVPVPTCGDWVMADLLRHVGRVYLRAGTLVSERSTTQQDFPPEPPEDADPITYVCDALDELVAALASCDPETPVWNWSDQPPVAAFWARRMAHESAIHRYDAQKAHSLAQPIDADLAHDGMDELVDVILPRILTRDKPAMPEATILFDATDEGDWPLRFGPEGLERLEVAKEPDVTATGTASALLLAAYGRVPWSAQNVEGEAAVLDDWSHLLHF
jgi:uncharacterized protein (TIGR03083 family)